MDLGKRLGKGLGNVVDRTVKTGVSLAGKGIQRTPLKEAGKWVEEVAPLVGQATGNTVKLAGTVVDGTVTAGVGLVRKDEANIDKGVEDLKKAGGYVVRDVTGTLKKVTENGVEVLKGVAYSDRRRATEGIKTLGKTVVAGSAGTNFEKDEDVVVQARKPAFVARQEDASFPQFTPIYEVKLPEELIKASNKKQINYCNHALSKAIQEGEAISDKLALNELDRINLEHGMTPENFVWHHYEIPGVMQLVDEEEHNQVPHMSAKVMWG